MLKLMYGSLQINDVASVLTGVLSTAVPQLMVKWEAAYLFVKELMERDGFSPTIDVFEETDKTYILNITDYRGSYLTPNLMPDIGQIGPPKLIFPLFPSLLIYRGRYYFIVPRPLGWDS